MMMILKVCLLLMAYYVSGLAPMAAPRGVEIFSKDMIGAGTYGEVFAAASESGEALVAKKCRDDALSKKYFDIERSMHEKIGDKGLYRGLFRKHKVFSWESFLLFRRVEGKDLRWYAELGACGIDALVAAWGVPIEAEECCVDEETCWSDPEVARASDANAIVALKIIIGASKAVNELHSLGICHRDIKPANLLVEPKSGECYVIDLGSAVDVETRLGFDRKRSPVSPRYCPPEKFVDLKYWKTFDTYSIGLTALRFLLSPALRSDNDLDNFNEEFRKANFDLDKWLGNKMASTALPLQLVAPLAALSSSRGPELWLLINDMTKEKPSERIDVNTAMQRAQIIMDKYERKVNEKSQSSVRFALPEKFFKKKKPHMLLYSERRATLEAPVGLELEDSEDGLIVTKVVPNLSAAKLGAPLKGDLLRTFEWKNGFKAVETVEDATAAAKKFPKGALVELQFERRQDDHHQEPRRSLPTMARLGSARRRGAARAATEDATAIGVIRNETSEIYRLDELDYATRKITQEKTVNLESKRGVVFGVVADGHGGQSASRHCADRLPDILCESFKKKKFFSLASSVKSAWDRCVEEYTAVEKGVGAVCACAVFDFQENKGAVLHCGDARVVAMDRNGNVLFATHDHCLSDASERKAALNRGCVIENGRVRANAWSVAVPRALGSQTWRDAGIVPVADVASFDPTQVHALIVASDGLFDVLSSDDVALYVRSRQLFRPNESASDIAKNIIHRAASIGSQDDISVAIILIDHHHTDEDKNYEEF